MKINGQGMVGSRVEKAEPRDGDVRAPVFRFSDQRRRPAVGVRDFEKLEHPWGPNQTHRIQFETLHAKSVDDVAQTLPQEYFNHGVSYIIGELRVSIGRLDIGQRVWNMA